MAKNINCNECVVSNIDENLIFDEKKLLKLAKNLFHSSNYSNSSLTISVLGNWGIGKTSFINLLLCILSKDKHGEYHKNPIAVENDSLIEVAPGYSVLRFNAWLYGKSEISKEFILAEYLVQEILRSSKYEGAKKFLTKSAGWLAEFSKNTIEAIKAEAEAEVTSIGKIKVNFDGLKFPEPKTSIQIGQFRKTLQETIKRCVAEDEKIILVIDDLDRIPPNEAISIIDSTKLFLDNPSLIIFFLNDKRIVKQGLIEKFGSKIGVEIASEYFDKLMKIDIDLSKYLRTNEYKSGICEFISGHDFIKNTTEDFLSYLEKADGALYADILKMRNFRLVKKLFKNLQVQGPSIYESGNSPEEKMAAYVRYLKTGMSTAEAEI